MSLSRRKILTIIGVTAILLLISLAIVKFFSSPKKPEVVKNKPEDTTVSMEDGSEITGEQVEARQKMEQFANESMKKHLEKESLGSTVTIQDYEWYLTDENENYNILVYGTIEKGSEFSRFKKVAEISYDEKTSDMQLVKVYPPDDRYKDA
ncbi:hypothetical protein CR969_02060 [Candidatus Saccharibacteria bacterium]|nr:MAG: hypothetical protein CR969_02060 [Candidatus Saccharibacteria bacterium]